MRNRQSCGTVKIPSLSKYRYYHRGDGGWGGLWRGQAIVGGGGGGEWWCVCVCGVVVSGGGVCACVGVVSGGVCAWGWWW